MSKSSAFSSSYMQRIAQYNFLARTVGMSYGQYIAHMEEKKRERTGLTVKAKILEMKEKETKEGKNQ